MIFTYQLGQSLSRTCRSRASPDRRSTPAASRFTSTAYFLYFNDGINQIHVVAEYKDDPRETKEKMAESVPKVRSRNVPRGRSWTPTPTRGERRLRLDRDLARLRFGLLRDRERQHTAIELGLDAASPSARSGRWRSSRVNRAVLALVERVGLAVLALFRVAMPGDREHAVIDTDVEVLLLDARQIGS